MQPKLQFEGTGKELFGKLFVGVLLCAITAGIYAPWFAVSLYRYLYSRTAVSGPNDNSLKFQFNGQGGELFKILFLGGLFSVLTAGIYSFWFMANAIRYLVDHSEARDPDGNVYALRFTATGAELFKASFVGALLSSITLGIYGPWFLCNFRKLLSQRTEILENGQKAGQLDFVGQGGALFGKLVGGGLLTLITAGIYAPWFAVNLTKYFRSNTRIEVSGITYVPSFEATGGAYFMRLLVDGLLISVTLGIYSFWAIANQLRFQAENTLIEATGATPALQRPRSLAA